MNQEFKVFDAEIKSTDQEKLIVEHFITTENVDRHGDIVRSDGMKIFGRPVVLLGHGRDHLGREPIAKNLSFTPGSFNNRKGILARTQFYPDEVGKRLFGKTTTGVMPNWSIGFIPIKSEPLKTGGRELKEWELVEYSLVATPANPDAQTPKKDDAYGGLCFKVFDDIPGELVTRDVKGICEKCGIVEGLYTLKGEKAVRNDCPNCGKTGGEEKPQEPQEPTEPEEGKEADPPDDKAVILYKKTPVAPKDTPWSGPAEVAKADVATLKKICVWYDSTKPDLKGSYKGPHHKADGDNALVPNGVKALAAVLMGARGGMNIPEGDMAGVKSHVGKHYADCGMGDPPWKKELPGGNGQTLLDVFTILNALAEKEKVSPEERDSVLQYLAKIHLPDLAEFFAPEGDGDGRDAGHSETLNEFKKDIAELKARIEELTPKNPPAAEPGAAEKDGDPPPVEIPPEPAKGPKRLVFREDEERQEPTPNLVLALVASTVRQALEKKAQTEIDRLTGKVR